MFLKFIAYMKEINKTTRSPQDLIDWHSSFAVTLQRNNSNAKQKVDWEGLVKAYKLDDH